MIIFPDGGHIWTHKNENNVQLSPYKIYTWEVAPHDDAPGNFVKRKKKEKKKKKTLTMAPPS